MDRIDRNDRNDSNWNCGHFLSSNCNSKIVDFASEKTPAWSATHFIFFPYGTQPFYALCIYLKLQNKRLHFIFLLLDLELVKVIQGFGSALTLKSSLIFTEDRVMIMTSTLLLMCWILLWHFHVSYAFSVTFWTACNTSKLEIFRNK